MLLGGFREMERVFLMTDGGPGGKTEIIGTYIYRATRSAGSNIGLVCAAAIVVLIVAFFDFLYSAETYRKEWIGGINDEKETGKKCRIKICFRSQKEAGEEWSYF